MKKWQYCELDGNEIIYFFEDGNMEYFIREREGEYFWELKRRGSSVMYTHPKRTDTEDLKGKKTEIEFTALTLARLGNRGWEIVRRHKSGGFFKRPIED